jgi:UDP-N-acetylmuramate dehydrogenase
MIPVFVLGGGSNLLIADRGFDGLVLRIGLQGVTWE